MACFVVFCRHDFNIAVLKAFVSLSDFTGMILVQALRSEFVTFKASDCVSLFIYLQAAFNFLIVTLC